MNVKQYLDELNPVMDSMISAINEIDYLESIKSTIGSLSNKEWTQGSRKQSAPFENAVIRIEDLLRQVRKEYQIYLQMYDRARHHIMAVRDTNARNVLKEYHLLRKTESEIAGKFHVSTKTVRRRLYAGYEEVSALTGYPMPPVERMPARAREPHEIGKRMLKEVYTDD